MKKILCLLLILLPVLTGCSKDDEPSVDASEIQGVWECTDCDVVSISGLNGLSVPDMVIDLIKGNIEDQMIGERITISSGVKVNGDVIIFPESGISWKILSLTDNRMTVQYDTSSSAGGYGLNMTVKAQYKKIN